MNGNFEFDRVTRKTQNLELVIVWQPKPRWFRSEEHTSGKDAYSFELTQKHLPGTTFCTRNKESNHNKRDYLMIKFDIEFDIKPDFDLADRPKFIFLASLNKIKGT